MKYSPFVVLLLFLVSCGISEQKQETKANQKITEKATLKKASGKTITFYNVENLFDIHNDPKKEDEWFTPESKTNWNEEKYQLKLERIAEVIHAIDKENPILVGMVEIENKTVLKDLIKEDDIDEASYKIISEESPDERGIDVALLYNPSYFEYLSHETISINFPKSNDKTRDILYVKGNLDKEELHIFVNHWPSRSEGQEKSEPKRLFVAKQLRKKVEKILNRSAEAKILIMGDFNDHPDNKSITDVLQASGQENLKKSQLFNLAAELHAADKGSYFYKGDWGMLDQMMISKGLLQAESGITIRKNTLHIFDENFILFKHPKYGTWQPNRTYSGPKYHGGYSDHLPIYITLN